MATPPDTKLEQVERLDRVRPTVVVRRRVYEVPPSARVGAHILTTGSVTDASGVTDDEEDNGPPSSVNVARALANLRSDELARLDKMMEVEEQEEAEESARAALVAQAEAPPPSVPTVRIGPTTPLPDLARQMSVTSEELVTALVMRGFFSVTAKTALPREIAHAAAEMFGWRAEDVEGEDAPSKASASASASASAKAKANAAPAKAKAPTKPKANAGGATKKPTRRGR